MANVILRPNADIDSGWSTSTTSRFAALTEAGDLVTQPTAPSTTHSISSATNGAVQTLDLTTQSGVSVATAATLWFYAKTTDNDKITAELLNSSNTSLGSGTTGNLTTSYAWYSVSISGLTLSQADVNGLRLSFTYSRTGGTSGTNNIAAAYVDLTYTANQVHQGSAAIVSASTVTAAGTVTDPNAIAIVNKTSAANPTGAESTNHTYSVPSGLQNNDVMIAEFALNGQTITTPASGWTLHRAIEDITNPRTYIYYRVVTDAGSEPSSYTWVSGVAVASAGGIIAFRHVDTTTPIEASSYDFSATTSLTAIAPSITTLTNKAMLVGGASGNSSTTTWTSPSPLVEQWDQGAGKSTTLAAGEIIDTAGATGTRTFTQSATREWNAYLFALKRASTGPTTHHGSASIVSSSTVAASGKRIALGSASVASASTVACSGTLVKKGAATVASTSTVAASGTKVWKGSAAVVSASSVSATATLTQRASATIVSVSAVSATAKATLRGSAAVASSSTVAATGKRILKGSAAIASASTVTAIGNTAKHGSAAVVSNSSVTSAGVRVAKGAATVASTSTVTAVGSLRARGAASISSTSTLAATARKTLFGSASVNSNSTVTATAKLIARATAAIVSTSTVTADGVVDTPEATVHHGSAAIVGTSSVAATAKRLVFGSALINSQSTVTASGKRTQRGTAAIVSASSVIATATRRTFGAATIASTSSVAAQARLIKKGSAAVSSSSTLGANGKVLKFATAAITSTSQVTAIGSLIASGQAAVSSTSVITAVGRVLFSETFESVESNFIPTQPNARGYPSVSSTSRRFYG